MRKTKHPYEIMPPEYITKRELNDRLCRQINTLSQLKEKLATNMVHAPEGRLRAIRNKNTMQFFQVADPSKKNGTYMPATKLDLIKQLAQKDYDSVIIKAINEELRLLSQARNAISRNHILNAHNKFPEAKRPLITPIIETNEAYCSRWLAAPYESSPHEPGNTAFITARHELVRSKSELLIADILNRLHIPYRYEYPLKLKYSDGTNHIIYPDFCCLNVHKRMEIYWEHFGMMDKPEYLSSTMKKLNTYIANGFFVGDKLIYTQETAEIPISTPQIERMARHYLL